MMERRPWPGFKFINFSRIDNAESVDVNGDNIGILGILGNEMKYTSRSAKSI